MPERHIFHGRNNRHAHETRKAGEIFGENRIALVRHGDEPFWPGEKNSSASSTSVRCMWRISIATFSIEEAITPRVAKNIAWRSRGMTCVETGSGTRPSCSQTYSSTDGSILAKVPTAPEIAPVATSARAATRRARLRLISRRSGRRSGPSWSARHECRGCGRCGPNLCVRKRGLQCGEDAVHVGEQQVGGANELNVQRRVEHVRTKSCPDGRSGCRDR